MRDSPGFAMRTLRQWARRRHGPDGEVVELHARRIYILPTRGGLVFGLVFFVMLLGALNYSNNMGFALAFVLTAVAVVSIHHCQRNLAGLRVSVGRSAPVFAGEPLRCVVQIENRTAGSRWQVAAGPVTEATPAADIPPGETATLVLELPTRRRGLQRGPEIRISSRHPLGLFEAWVWISPSQELLAYPAPAGDAMLPADLAGVDAECTGETARGTDEFVGLRALLPGEPPSRIAWKTWARSGELLAKDYRSAAASTWLDWNALPPGDVETRLALLTRMLIDLDAGRRPWGLRLPGQLIPLGEGREHYHRCLRALALFDGGPS